MYGSQQYKEFLELAKTNPLKVAKQINSGEYPEYILTFFAEAAGNGAPNWEIRNALFKLINNAPDSIVQEGALYGLKCFIQHYPVEVKKFLTELANSAEKYPSKVIAEIVQEMLEECEEFLPIINKDTCCMRANHVQVLAHPCPYQTEINDDSETLCECCIICEGNCCDDI